MKKIIFLHIIFNLCFCSVFAHDIITERLGIFYKDSNLINYKKLLSANQVILPGNQKNLIEWQKRYPQIKNLNFFDELIYQHDLESIDILLSGKTGDSLLANNEFAQWLRKNKEQATLTYLRFAKKCEPFVMQLSHGDNDKPTTYDEQDLFEEGEELMNQVQDQFLKQRYAFQLVRLSYRYYSNRKTIELFDKIAANYPKNYIYYRTLLHKAFALKNENEQAETLQIFAEIFTYEPSLQQVVVFNLNNHKDYYNFTFNNEAWQEVLDKRQEKSVKNSLYQLYLLNYQDINPLYLQGSLANEASNEQLKVIFLYQLSIIEKDYFVKKLNEKQELDSTQLTYGYDAPPILPQKKVEKEPKGFFAQLLSDFADWLYEKIFRRRKVNLPRNEVVINDFSLDNPIILTFEDLAIKIAEKRPDESATFFMGVAYLQMMRKKFYLAQASLQRVSVENLTDKTLINQWLYLDLLLKILSADSITPILEDTIVTQTQKLWKDSLENDNWQKTLLFAELGRKYLADQAVGKASLAFLYINHHTTANIVLDFYATHEDLEMYLTFMKGKANTPIKKLFEHLLPKTEKEKIHFIRDLQGTKVARLGKLEEALVTFNTISPNYWQLPEPPKEKEKEGQENLYFNVMINGKMEKIFVNGGEENLLHRECLEITTNFGTSFTEEDTTIVFANKKLFLQELLKLQQLAANKKGDDAAKLFIRIANALYHTPFWLYNNAIWQCDGMRNALANHESVAYPFNINLEVATNSHNRRKHLALVYCKPYWAAFYYAKAFEVATSTSLKATALLGQCMSWENQLATHWESGVRADYRPFQLLQKQYPNTTQYKKLIDYQERKRNENF